MTRRLTFVLFLAAAYLSLVNLDRVGLWSDEAINRNIGATLLATGDLSGWNGRNLTGGSNGRSLNAELRDTFPPLSYPVTGLSVALFGAGPAGARILHALLGLAGLAFCHMFLRQVIAGRRERRLLLLTFAFVALSADLSMFFRQARYYSLTFLALFAMLYGYERFWRTGRPRHYLLMAGGALAGFFSHYASGAAAIAALACWHLLLRGRATSRRGYLLYAAAALLVAMPGAAYMHWIGVLGAGFGQFSGDDLQPSAWHDDFLQRLLLYPIQAFRNDWLPYVPLLWYAAWRGLLWWRRRPAPPGARAADRLLGLGALYLAAACVVSVQPVSVIRHAIDSRYFFCVIPFFAPLKALLADWLWTRSRWAGGAALAALLLTNASSYPFNTVNFFSLESTFGPRLLQHAAALHRPYGHPLDEAIRLLDEHAADGDLVYAPLFHYREAMTAANGDRLIYCCHLDARDARARAILARLPGTRLAAKPLEADWQLRVGYPGQQDDELMFHFEIFAHGEDDMRFTQKPEPDRHMFHSPPNPHSFLLLKKRRGAGAGALP